MRRFWSQLRRIRLPLLAVLAAAVLVLGAILAVAVLRPGGARVGSALSPHPVPDDVAPPGHLPPFLLGAPEKTREVYRWAAANAGLLRFIACYCGCVAMGHDSNAACYLRGARWAGTIWYERHGARCGGCLAVTRDVMALKRSGISAAEIRRFIDAKHGRTGAGTPTLWPPD